VRLHVTAFVGETVWAQFRVDLVGSDLNMLGDPDQVAALAEVNMPDVPQRGYRAYPLVDHVADKVAATVQRYGSAQRPSTRFRDLVDLVAIAMGASVDAQQQIRALTSEMERRAITPPETFNVPDRALWEPGYAAEAKRSLLASAHTLDEALAVVRPFVDPVLVGTARGTWDHERGAWVEH
jgi:hypothetical protein